MKIESIPPMRLWCLPLLPIMVSVAGGFALIRYDPVDFDVSLLLWFRVGDDTGRLVGPGWLAGFWQGLSWLGNTVPRTAMAGIAILALLAQRRWHTAGFIATVLTSGFALSIILKNWVARPRPQLVEHLAHVTSQSFPSGHALNGTLFYGMAALLLAQLLPQRSSRWILYAVAAGLSVATGVSRIVLGLHYPTDVMAGWVVGAAWLWLWFAVAEHYWPQVNASHLSRYGRV